MPIEVLAPDGIPVQGEYSALTIADVDEDPDSPDGAWGTWDGQGDSFAHLSFPTPTITPKVGAGLQEFRVLIRKTASGGNATTYSIDLYEDATLRANLISGTLTSTTGEVVSATWDASLLLTDPNGSAVRVAVIQTGGGGGNPSNRRGIELGAVEWLSTYDSGSDGNASGQATGAGAARSEFRSSGGSSSAAVGSFVGASRIESNAAAMGVGSGAAVGAVGRMVTGSASGQAAAAAGGRADAAFVAASASGALGLGLGASSIAVIASAACAATALGIGYTEGGDSLPSIKKSILGLGIKISGH